MSRLSLSQFIRTSLPALGDEWQQHATTCMPAAGNMGFDELRNHVRELLLWIADDMESTQTDHEQREKSLGRQPRLISRDTAAETHASLRVGSGFTLEQVVGEFRALRAAVLRRRAATESTITKDDLDEMTRFNECIDQMLGESVARYTQMVEDHLREADRNKDRFLATLSHELRNPFNAVALGIATMPTEGGLVKSEMVAMLTRQTAHLKRLVDDLLDLSRIANDRITLDIQCIDIRVSVRDALAGVQEMLKRKEHEVDCEMPAEAVAVSADATRITQIVANLLHNAAKYSVMRSTIKLSVKCCGGTVEIRVRDNGRGISPEQLPHLFKPFYSPTDAKGRAEQGLGLGLAISHRLASLHGGTLTAQSSGVGAGAEFCLVIPTVQS